MEELKIDFNHSNALSTLAIMGHLHREQAKKNGMDLDSKFEQCMKDVENIKDPVVRLQTAMSNYTNEILKTMPLENRCIFILNELNKVFLDKVDEDKIDWKKINEILFKNPLKYDYNLCDSVHTASELTNLLMAIRQSYILGGPWYKQKCKTCGEIFYLYYGELQSYVKKGLHIPKRCKDCIMESKGQESYRQKKQREEKEREEVRKALLPEDNRTAMQIAFEKAKKEKKG